MGVSILFVLTAAYLGPGTTPSKLKRNQFSRIFPWPLLSFLSLPIKFSHEAVDWLLPKTKCSLNYNVIKVYYTFFGIVICSMSWVI